MPQIFGEKISKIEIFWIVFFGILVAWVVVFGINYLPHLPEPAPPAEQSGTYRVRQPDGTILYYIEENK